jgi:hypothetical protein
MNLRFTLGCDPEIFCLNDKEEYKSAIDTFGGTKELPRRLDVLGDGFAVQEDNVALEFNIPPSSTSDEFNKNINAVVNYLATIAKDAFNLHFSKESGVYFPVEELMDPRALEFGCDPDYNGWTGKKNPRPEGASPRLRSAGGHVHVGLEQKLSMKDKMRIVRLMDLHLGIPSVLLDNGIIRKELYGKAGAMRFKPYGLEYRTLSNFWVFSDSLNKWVWDSTERALDDFQKGRDVLDKEALITSTINDNNTRVAAEMVSEYGLLTA